MLDALEGSTTLTSDILETEVLGTRFKFLNAEQKLKLRNQFRLEVQNERRRVEQRAGKPNSTRIFGSFGTPV
jgi:hypothetical protein